MLTYRIGIIGCRSRGIAGARAYPAHPRTELLGFCDLIEEEVNTLGEEVGVNAGFTNLDDMLRFAG